jgi:Ni/Fe-hydrogenase subunit HybB-like protein
MTHHHHLLPKPIGGRILGAPVLVLLGIFGVALCVIAYRFVAGIGAVSNMNDGYTWGIWEPVNVVVFTGIGAGAYSVGLLTYLLNRGQYHPLVRPAVLLGAVAYSLGGLSIIVALGRYWNMFWLFLPGMWNLSSVLIEVAVCVIVYVCVLWIEVLPAVLDGMANNGSASRAAWARRWGARLARAMPFLIALAMLLPTMHQSSLGGLMLVAGPKLHPLWHTALLPLLALVSCLSMGFGVVVALTDLMAQKWRATNDRDLLTDMAKVNGGILVLFVALRVVDIVSTGKAHLLMVPDMYLGVFVLEAVLFLAPAVMFLVPSLQRKRGALVAGALMAVTAGAVWRIDTFITCYHPMAGGRRFQYFPSFGEIAVTVGMAALGGAVFIIVSRLLPVVVVEEPTTPVGDAAGRPASDGLRWKRRPHHA